MEQKPAEDLIKLLVIGNSGVGKTCLMFRFCNDTFAKNQTTTIGVDFKTRSVRMNGKTTKLQIWDTAGQERFHTIPPNHYRGMKGLFLVFDVTDPESFSQLNNWQRILAQHVTETTRVKVIGNKCDLDETRQVSTESGMDYAARIGGSYIETSALSGQNVEEAFLSLARDIVNETPHNNENKISNIVELKEKSNQTDSSQEKGCCK
eukprot:TRINITY_DN1090_c0_g1_i1.p1 TRINITY_DN1090_c0_g1~~TRINITY_DN1090_c0_g1_i1.p1  ORF type:complete len:219 (+),score=39.38 TRINITY_DN1090_c0_g1_i1:40-657(+)